MIDENRPLSKHLEARIQVLEQNLDLSLKTISMLTMQCKNAATILESLSANQMGQQAQIQSIAEGLDGLAAALGMFSDEIDAEDDTWN